MDITTDKSNVGRVMLQPGAALDALGREIIVPTGVSVDPYQPTDDLGKVFGNRLTNADKVLVGLVYAEHKTDMVPKLVADCSANGKCDWNTVQEGYYVVVRQTRDAPQAAPSCDLPGGFPPAADALHKALAVQISATAAADPTDLFLPLALVDLDPVNLQNIDSSVGRPLVYGNRLLYELILCLSVRVNALTQAPFLRYVSGDGQPAKADTDLKDPIVVQLVDSAGHGVPNQTVKFHVTSGGGSVAAGTVNTDANGFAQTTWHLPPAKHLGPRGPQEVTASAAGSVLTVTFRATITK